MILPNLSDFCGYVVAFAVCCSLSCTAQTNDISDGTSFTGWEGDKEFFRIEDGAIVAGSLERQIPTNQFLCSEADFDDFELTVEVKFTSTVNNGGIQIRSERIPDHHEVIGYQSDIGYAGSTSVWGSLYDESRRKVMLATADQELVGRVLDREGWNTYKIRCQGPNIQHWINGTQVLDYVEMDSNIPAHGKICVQIHGGKPAEAWYRKISLVRL